MNYSLAFIGFGVVGQGLAELLQNKKKELLEQYGCSFSIVAITDTLKGTVQDAGGIDIPTLLENVRTTGIINNIKKDSLEVIRTSGADIIVEVSYTDIHSGQPALDHIRTALGLKKHVVTTNKGPIALAYDELMQSAKRNNVQLRFEGTVMSGTPVLNLVQFGLAGATVTGVRGILNGTTNFILTEMESGMPYEQALLEAQRKGYAEAVPTNDVEGIDTMAKIIILSKTIFGVTINVNDVPRKGITNISQDDIRAARSEGKRWKLIGNLTLKNGSISATVSPEKILLTDPLAHVMGAMNAISFTTEELGTTTISGAGAGKKETGFALLSDLLSIHRQSY